MATRPFESIRRPRVLSPTVVNLLRIGSKIPMQGITNSTRGNGRGQWVARVSEGASPWRLLVRINMFSVVLLLKLYTTVGRYKEARVVSPDAASETTVRRRTRYSYVAVSLRKIRHIILLHRGLPSSSRATKTKSPCRIVETHHRRVLYFVIVSDSVVLLCTPSS
jgi:hypothetical protein